MTIIEALPRGGGGERGRFEPTRGSHMGMIVKAPPIACCKGCKVIGDHDGGFLMGDPDRGS
jgi:hypothetical protein